MAETEALGARLAAELAPDGVLLLEGDLGSGKTALTRGVAAALGVPPGEVLSPTFNLIREHRGSRGRLVHVDLYRLEAADGAGLEPQVAALGLEELLAGSGLKVVEWAERLPFPVPGALRLRLQRAGEEEREIEEAIAGQAPAYRQVNQERRET